KTGRLTQQDIDNFQHKNVITRALGMAELPGIDVTPVDLLPGDVCLLCCDGLTGMVSDARIAEILQAEKSLETACNRLIAEANDRRVFERPEFHGIHASDLRQAISRAAQQVSQVRDLSVILDSMAQRLPDRPSRELAFGLAASVAWADRRSHPPELELLKALQKAFELDDSDVARLYELASENAPLPPTQAH